MSEIQDQLRAEGVAKEGRATMIRGRRAFPGWLYVTSDRVVFLKTSPMFGAFGAIGALVGAALKPKKVEVEIPLGAITGLQRGKFGVNKNILEDSHGAGEPARFAVKPYEEWEQAIQAAGGNPAA